VRTWLAVTNQIEVYFKKRLFVTPSQKYDLVTRTKAQSFVIVISWGA
jgi:hypothetical protein